MVAKHLPLRLSGSNTFNSNVGHDKLGNKSHQQKSHCVEKGGKETKEGERFFDLAQERGGGL